MGTGNVVDLAAIRRLVAGPGAVPSDVRAAVLGEMVAGDRTPAGDPILCGGRAGSEGTTCRCAGCDQEALSFPPVALADEGELAAAVFAVPLVADARRLAAWTGTRPVTEQGLLRPADAEAVVADLGLPPGTGRPSVLHLLWVVAVNGGLLQIVNRVAAPGPLTLSPALPAATVLEFWDGVVMDVLDRADESLTGSAVVDDHLAEMLATMYSVSAGLDAASLAKGILQSHEVACAAGPDETRRLAEELPGELNRALALLAYCGLIEGAAAGRPRLTPLGLWAVRRDLLREGHDVPTIDEASAFAELGAAELVEAIVSGSAGPSAVAMWLERRPPAHAAQELLAVAAAGGAGRRGAVGTILEEIGPEAEAPVREALADPALCRYAASWLHVRDLPAPTLGPADTTWLAVDTLAALLEFAGSPIRMEEFDALRPGEELMRLMADMVTVAHPDAIAVLDSLAARHPDPAVAKAARKAALRIRSGAIEDGGPGPS
jgi:hypothetical protein